MEDQKLPFVIMRIGTVRSDEILNYAIKPAVQAALSISEDITAKIRIDEIVRYENSDQNISNSILQKIQDCSFIICDTTGNRPNCYFELGHALALRKFIVLIHDKNEERPHFDISGLPYYFYTGINDLKKELEDRISHFWGINNEKQDLKIDSFFERCKLPIVALDGDGTYEHRLSDTGESTIQIDRTLENKFSFPNEWGSKFLKVLERKLEQFSEQGNSPWNGDLVRIKDYHPRRDETSGRRYLRIETERSDYFSFISSNHGLQFLGEDDQFKMTQNEKDHIYDLRSSALVNPLTVSLCLIIEHKGKDWILIQERNTQKTSHGSRRFQCSAAGMVSPIRDTRPHGIDIFATAKNELEEELGIQITENLITILGLIRETNNFEIAFVAEACIKRDPNTIVFPSADSFEVLKVRACELTPEAVSRFIKENGGLQEFVPLGIGAIMYSLMKRYPLKTIETYFKSI
jgi:hypothetical protein